jgi:hypothetical protein
MLETMFLGCYLLFILKYYLFFHKKPKIDANRSYDLLHINSENNNIPVIFNNCYKYTNIQSAENCKGFSETTRQISDFNCKDESFFK